MLFLLDANLPRSAIGAIRESGHGVEFARDAGLGAAPDAAIAARARATGDFPDGSRSSKPIECASGPRSSRSRGTAAHRIVRTWSSFPVISHRISEIGIRPDAKKRSWKRFTSKPRPSASATSAISASSSTLPM